MKTRDKVVVILSFLIISILGITLSFANKNIKEGKVNNKVKFSTFETGHGTFDSMFYFSSSSSNYFIDNDSGSVTYYKNDGALEDNEIDAHFYSVFNRSDMSSSIMPGQLVYMIPSTTLLFHNSDFSFYQIDENSNTVTFYTDDTHETVLGYLKLGSGMSYCQFNFSSPSFVSSCSGNADYYWYYFPEGLMISNGKEISSDNDYTVDLKATYAFDSAFFDGADNNINPMLMLIGEDNYFYNAFNIHVEEKVENMDLSNVNSLEEVVYTSWQSEWGSEGNQYDYYVKYGIQGYIDYNSYFFTNYGIQGDNNIVAFSNDGLSYQTGDKEDFDDLAYCSVGGSGYLDIQCYVIVGYDVGDTAKDVSMSIEMDANGTTKEFNWNHTLEPKGSTITPEYPSGVSKDYLNKITTISAGEGAVNKLLNSGSVNFGWLIEANGISSINNGYKAFNLWNLTNGGTTNYTVKLSSVGEEIDSDYSNSVNPYSLNGTDYSIVSFYPQDDKEYNYEVDNNTYRLSLDTDYANYGLKEVFVSINGGTLEKIGHYVRTGSGIAYTAADSRTISNNNVTESNPVLLPENTTKVEVRYTGVRAAVYIGFNVNTQLNGTDAVKNKINSLTDVILKNRAQLSVNDEDNSKLEATYLTKMEINSYSSKTSTVESRIDDGKTDVVSYVDKFYDQLNYNDDTRAEALNMLPEQKNGVIYELLPAGAELYGDITVKTIGNNANCAITTNSEAHYDGTNRTLVTINVGTCPSNYYDTGSSIQSGYVVNYKIKYTSAANQSYGTDLYADVMYAAAGTLGNGYSSAEEAPSSKFSDSSVKTIFDGLVNGNNNLLFATAKVTVESMSISEGTYGKTVSLNEENYTNVINVVESKSYTYKLQYSFTSELEEITNVILIDKLESNYGNNNHFNGYLEDVDVQYLRNLGVNVNVYYSIFDVDTSTFNSSQWTLEKPADVTTIKAIAVDCGTYRFSMGEAPEVLIKMKAPNNYQNSIAAYNKSNILYKYPGDNNIKQLNTEVTQVNLVKADISVTGTSNFGTGTSSNPAEIDGDLKYTITVKNNDTANSFDNVKVEINLPEGMKSSNSNDSTVYFNIDHLNASETKTLELNMEFVGSVDVNKTYTASYKLAGLNGNDYAGKTGYIYNKVVVPVVEGHKYVKTIDSVNFTDEADVLIKKDEEFSYRISIKNTSSRVANNVVVTDTIPEGLDIVTSSIGNGVVSGNKITWEVTVNANSTLNIDYKVKLGSDATLGTVYRSAANVVLSVPYLGDLMVYDEDTNMTSVVYQIASNVKVTNTLSGALANSAKDFEYEVMFNGSSANAGRYDVYKDNNLLSPLDISESGTGSYTFTLKGSETVTFKNLTGDINYTIKQKKVAGYTTHVNANESVEGDYVVASGTTSTEGTVTVTYTNAYAASGSANINAKVTYDKTMSDNMFKLDVDGEEYNIPASGIMPEVTKSYNNVVGQYTYVIKQTNTGLPKISYDSKEYKAVVNVTDNGNGSLNTQVKYYDGNKEINEVVFNNTYLPNGLTIKNVNNSEYVDESKEYTYSITLTDGDGTYEVKDSKGTSLENLTFINGVATYNVTLGSNESILISDLPNGVNYSIKQNKLAYYTTTSEDEFTEDENEVVVTGVTTDGSKEIKFVNKYVTKASFSPAIKVTLEGKEMEDAEFKFKLLDVSSGSTSGYTSNALNDETGNVEFKSIEFTRPGTYVYEIVQLENGSNHIYFDKSKVKLTLVLTDNGDGTMGVESAYEYLNGQESLVNKYSEEPINKEEESKDKNPNTSDRIKSIIVLLWIVVALFICERWIRYRRYKMIH